VAADGNNSPIQDSLGLLKWRHSANQFGYRAIVPRVSNRLETGTGCTQCEYWSGSRWLLYAPCTAELASAQLTSVAGGSSGNSVPIDRDSWRAQFPYLGPIVDRVPDNGRGSWFEIIRLKNWSKGRVAIVGDAANAHPPFLGHGVGCAMMGAFALAQTIDRAGDLIDGLLTWELRERPVNEWVQWVACWCGQLAFLPKAARIAAFKAIDASGWVKRRTLLSAACRDVTRMPGPSAASAPQPMISRLIH
jgi:2-polyprenyl-6-methoxyphenol hydroxylase-like FAD-dependent oxidoreductase